jgi:dTMP kinase
MEQIATLEQLVQGDLRPDLTLYLDVPVEVGQSRIEGRKHDRLEQEQRKFHESVRATYRNRAASEERMQLVDASGTLPEVQAQIRILMTDYLRS